MYSKIKLKYSYDEVDDNECISDYIYNLDDRTLKDYAKHTGKATILLPLLSLKSRHYGEFKMSKYFYYNTNETAETDIILHSFSHTREMMYRKKKLDSLKGQIKI